MKYFFYPIIIINNVSLQNLRSKVKFHFEDFYQEKKIFKIFFKM